MFYFFCFFYNVSFCFVFVICTVSHKMIGLLYFVLAVMCGFVGFLYSCFLRLELHLVGCGFLFGDYHLYNVLITAHGLLMIFAFVMPVILGGYTNFYAPLLIGFPDMLFPRMNNLSFWLFVCGCLIFVTGFACEDGCGVGWTLYPTLICIDFHFSVGVDFVLFAVHVLGLSSILNSINVVGTVFVCRRKFWTLLLFCLFIWGVLLTCFLLILCLPILAGGVTLILLDRNFNTAFYDCCGGGDLVLFQHLFWFFGHPEVYIIIIPVFGCISLLLDVLGLRFVYSYLAMLYSLFCICLLGFFVWAHHMFVIGMDVDSRMYFGVVTVLIGLPTCIKLFNWLFTMFFCDLFVCFCCELFLVWCFIFMFLFGGCTGLLLANVGLDLLMHDTYFVVAHFHYVLSLGAVIGIFGGFCLFFMRLLLCEYWCMLLLFCFFFLVFGSNLVFLPMHYIGLLAFPRRITDYPVVLFVCSLPFCVGFVIVFCFVVFVFCVCFFVVYVADVLLFVFYVCLFFLMCFFCFFVLVPFAILLWLLLCDFAHMLFDLLYFCFVLWMVCVVMCVCFF